MSLFCIRREEKKKNKKKNNNNNNNPSAIQVIGVNTILIPVLICPFKQNFLNMGG